ncbi:MAG: globin domain-containing protein [Panacibacter sp.]
MKQEQIQHVKRTWQMVAAIDPETVGGLFYNRLFEIAPEVKHMFKSPVNEQSRKLLSMIGYVISKLDKLDAIMDEVAKLAQRHVQYGVHAEHYYSVADALLWTLEKGLGSEWTEDVKKSWTLCYITLSNAMISVSDKKEIAA